MHKLLIGLVRAASLALGGLLPLGRRAVLAGATCSLTECNVAVNDRLLELVRAPAGLRILCKEEEKEKK